MNSRQRLMQRWCRQMTRRLNMIPHYSSSSIVVQSYLVYGPTVENLIEIQNFSLVLLHEELGQQRFPLIRFTAYSGQFDSRKITFGGAANNRLFKDLSAKPAKGARDQRLNLHKPEIVDLALRMETYLHRQRQHEYLPRRTEIQLPNLLAGFRKSTAVRLGFTEHPATADRITAGRPAHREYFGLTLLPAGEASEHLNEATAVFADLNGWPRFRAVQLPDVKRDLCGKHGPVKFDFYSSRFRGWHRRCRKARRSARTSRHAA